MAWGSIVEILVQALPFHRQVPDDPRSAYRSEPEAAMSWGSSVEILAQALPFHIQVPDDP